MNWVVGYHICVKLYLHYCTQKFTCLNLAEVTAVCTVNAVSAYSLTHSFSRFYLLCRYKPYWSLFFIHTHNKIYIAISLD